MRTSLKIGALVLLDIGAFYCSLLAAYYSRALLDVVYPRLAPLQLSLTYFRLTVLFLWFYSLFLFPLFRHLGKSVLYSGGLWCEQVIIIGAGKAGMETKRVRIASARS